MKFESGKWYPISTLDLNQFQFVLVAQDGAMRAYLWDPDQKCWMHPVGFSGKRLTDVDECKNPEFWSPLPDSPNAKNTVNP